MKFSIPKKLWVFSGYSAFFWACFFSFLLITFPSDIIKAKLINEVEKATGGRMQVEEVSLSPLGVTVENALIILPPKPPETKASRIDLTSLKLAPALSQFIRGRLGISLKAETLGGKISGAVGVKQDFYDLDFEFENLQLDKISALANLQTAKLKGALSGDLKIFFPPEIKERVGKIDLNINDAVISVGQLMGFEIPDVLLGKVNTTMTLNGELAEIKELKTESPELALQMDAVVNLKYNSVKNSTYQSELIIDVKDAFWDKNPKLVIIKDLPMLKTYLRRDNKTFGLRLAGTFARPPNPTPSRK